MRCCPETSANPARQLHEFRQLLYCIAEISLYVAQSSDHKIPDVVATDSFELLRETVGEEASTACRLTCHGDESVPKIARRQHSSGLTQASGTSPTVCHCDNRRELDVLRPE